MNSNLIEKEFEAFFVKLQNENLGNDEISIIMKPMITIYRIKQMKKLFLLFIGFGILHYLYNWCLELEWFINAIVRLFLIELLTYWDWTQLYHSKCLLDRPTQGGNSLLKLSQPSDAQTLIYREAEPENCALCDFLDSIDKRTNVTFSEISNSHLERGLPIIITNASDTIQLNELFVNIIQSSTDFLSSQSCDAFTNLLLHQFFNVDALFYKAYGMLTTKDRWFLQIRNCQFDAIKSARRFIRKPYYYPRYLAPSHSTWIIISHNFKNEYFRKIYISGLIIIQQLLGYLEIELQAKSPCNDKCAVQRILLKPKENFVFSTDLWLMSYRFVQMMNDNSNEVSSITTIMEIMWP